MTPDQIEQFGAESAIQAARDKAWRFGTPIKDMESAVVAMLMLALEMSTPDLSRDRRASLFNSDDE
jgi:hypothetical protein